MLPSPSTLITILRNFKKVQIYDVNQLINFVVAAGHKETMKHVPNLKGTMQAPEVPE
jgi:hypothetical protein